MNEKRIAIVCDSGTDTPVDFVAEHDIRVVPLLLNYTDGTYRSCVDIDSAQVVERFATEIPTTSLPSPHTIRETLEAARDDGYEAAVFVTIAGALSATNQTANLVASEMDFPVAVVDSKSIGLGAGLTVMAATRLAEKGLELDEIRTQLEGLARDSSIFFCPKTLSYLRKGGRIGEATYRLGSVLNIKPVMTCDPDGAYTVARKARGWERALRAEVDLICAAASKLEKVVLGICVSMNPAEPELFDRMEAEVRERVGNIVEVIRTSATPDLLVHTGPDFVGITCEPAIGY